MPKTPRFIAEEVGRNARVKANGRYRVLVELGPTEPLSALDPLELDYCCMPQVQPLRRDGIARLHAVADGKAIDVMRKTGRLVEVLADADAESRALFKTMRPPDADRFQGGRKGPPLLGRLI